MTATQSRPSSASSSSPASPLAADAEVCRIVQAETQRQEFTL